MRRMSTAPLDLGLIDAARSHWNRIRAGRPMPSRADLDPVDIPGLLPFTILVEVLRGPLDFRYRLLGTALDRIVSRNYKGVRFSDIPHIEKGGKLWSDHETVCRTCAPLLSAVDYVGPDQFVGELRHGLFPLSSDGSAVNMIWAVAEIGRKGWEYGGSRLVV